MMLNPLSSANWSVAVAPRATTMETGLFEIQADHMHVDRQARQSFPSEDVVHALLGRADLGSHDSEAAAEGQVKTQKVK
jgi:hypothetical protein